MTLDEFRSRYDSSACSIVQAGSFELLVKAYPPRRGGGLGAYLCGLDPGETALMSLGMWKKKCMCDPES